MSEPTQLTPEEIAILREIIQTDKNMKWLRRSMRIWLGWFAGAIISTFAVWKAVTEFFSIKIGTR